MIGSRRALVLAPLAALGLAGAVVCGVAASRGQSVDPSVAVAAVIGALAPVLLVTFIAGIM